MTKTIISPSILSADFANLEKDIKLIEKYGADWLHIDVMDGHFVPNITIGIPVVKSIRKITKMPFDVHLMIENPKKFIEAFVIAGADIITFHYETCNKEQIIDLIEFIKSFNVKVGLSIKPKTNAEEILPYLKYLDMVLVMTVEPGFSGQSFIHECAAKISVIKKNSNENLIIQVDGGINKETAKICCDLGANCLVAGNYIFKNDDIKLAINNLKNTQ